jgi:hypothetical protein
VQVWTQSSASRSGCNVRLLRTTHFKLLRTQGHVFNYSDAALYIDTTNSKYLKETLINNWKYFN